MKKIIAIAIFTIVLPSTVFAAMDPALKECVQRGYETVFQNEKNYCVLPDKNQCSIEEFNSGTCGAQYKMENYCITEGTFVWDTDKCCAGTEAYLAGKTLGQARCIKVSLTQKVYDQFRYNPYILFGGGLLIVIAIFFILKSKKRNI